MGGTSRAAASPETRRSRRCAAPARPDPRFSGHGKPPGEAAPDRAILSRILRKVYRDRAFWDLLDAAVGAGPFDGGCLICAKALQEAFGGEIVHIAHADCGQPEHYGVMVGPLVLDFDGPCPGPRAWVARFCAAESIPFPVVFRPGVGAPAGIPDCAATSSLLAGMIRDASCGP